MTENPPHVDMSRAEQEQQDDGPQQPTMGASTGDTIVRGLDDALESLDEFTRLPLVIPGAARGFCQSMQYAISGSVDDPAWKEPARTWQDFPWVTPVLGSGPVGLPDSFWAVAERLPDLVMATLRSSKHGHDPLLNVFRTRPDRRIHDFLEGLQLERIGRSPANPAAINADRSVDEFAAGLVLVAAQLTRVYYLVCQAAGWPVSRSGSEPATVSRPNQGELADEIAPTLETIDFVLNRLEGSPPARRLGPGFTAAVLGLLTKVKKDLRDTQELEVRTEHLRQLTDLSWQCLVWSVCGSTYPGWTELLLNLVLLQNLGREATEKRPRWRQLKQLSGQIATLIRPASQVSWDESRAIASAGNPAAAVNPARAFYDATAVLLWQQTAAGHAARRGRLAAAGTIDQLRMTAAGLPQAVAFVTSFDLELEMALLRNRPPGERFISVVVPVYLWKESSDEGEFLWLEGRVELPEGDITGAQALHALTHPVKWRAMYQGRWDLPEHPVVVRLTGSPLVDLAGADAEAAQPGTNEETLHADLRELKLRHTGHVFVHSATVDEYLALRQAEAEYFWVYSRGTFANITNRALPKSLLACREPGPVRFWLTVGVPLTDPAVRLRVLSQMSSRRFMLMGHGQIDGYPRETGNGKTRAHEIAGLAVNWRLDDDEAVLLISLGMEVIKNGRAEDIGKYLRHHAWHLGAVVERPELRASRNPCPEEPRAEGNVG